VRQDARCPKCGSLERHRLAYVLLCDRLAGDQVTLHSSPEPAVTRWLRSISRSYLSIDLDGSLAMRAMDLTRLDLPDASQTLVYCSHVLEHIPDDRSAMNEIRRVLQPGGVAAIQVPIRGPETDEDLTVTDPDERRARYRQFDHVRFYGLDISARLSAAGFAVETLDAADLPEELVERQALSLRSTQQVFLCTAV